MIKKETHLNPNAIKVIDDYCDIHPKTNKPLVLAVYITLADNMDYDTQTTTCSYNTLLKEVGVCRRTLSKALKILINDIKVVKYKKGCYGTNVYSFPYEY